MERRRPDAGRRKSQTPRVRREGASARPACPLLGDTRETGGLGGTAGRRRGSDQYRQARRSAEVPARRPRVEIRRVVVSEAQPLERLDDWDDFVKARYAPPPATVKP